MSDTPKKESNSGMSSAIGSVLSTAGNAVINAMNQRAQRRFIDQERKNAIELQNLANGQNLAFANSQNTYNDPLEQRKRMERAGVNPFTAMENISPNTAADIADSSSAYSPASYSPIQLDFNNVASAIAKMDEMKFTSDEARANRDHAKEMLSQQILVQLVEMMNANEEAKKNRQHDEDMAEDAHDYRMDEIDEQAENQFLIQDDAQRHEKEMLKQKHENDKSLQELRHKHNIETENFRKYGLTPESQKALDELLSKLIDYGIDVTDTLIDELVEWWKKK